MKISQLSLVLALLGSIGCASTSGLTSGVTSGTSSMMAKVGDTGKAVKGQVGTMGTAMGSAYTKTKKMVMAPFTTPTNAVSETDPTSLSGGPPVIGPELYVAQGQNYEFRNNFDKANEFYTKALEVEPNNLSALLSVARLANRQKDSQKALEYYAKAEKVSPKSTEIYSESGQIHVAMGQYAQARAQFQKAVNLEPTSRAHRVQLAGLMVDQGQVTEALQEIQQVDTPAMANYQIAYIYASRKNVPVAQQYLQAALQLDPNLQPARDLMGSLQNSALAQQAYGSYQQAGQVYQNVGNLYEQANQVYQQSTSAIGATPASATITR